MTKARATGRAARRRKEKARPPADDIMNRLERAVAFHRQGRLDKAEPLYRKIVRQAPHHHIALHLLGVVALERNDLEAAERLIGRALEIMPDYPEALNNRGNVYLRSARFAEALASYDRALALRPGFPDALNNRGSALLSLKRIDDAIDSYDAALAIRPDFVDALYNRGNAMREAKRPEEALASYGAALALQPDHADARRHRADVLRAMGRPDAALADYDAAVPVKADDVQVHLRRVRLLLEAGRAEDALSACDQGLAVHPDDAELLCGHGNALMLLQRWDAALADYEAALRLRPNLVDALINRGDALRALGRRDEALASLDAALAEDPHAVEAFNNRGNVLLDQNRVEEALADYDRALALRPDYAEALTNRGNALKEMRRLDEAMESYDAALAVSPQYALAQWNRACCRLLMGDFERGWPAYEWRWQTELKTAWRAFEQPLWLGGEPVGGRTILLHAEQGLGDTIQFGRLAAEVAALGARVILEVQPPLQPLMRGLAGPDRVIARGDPLPDFDIHCPLLSLPLALGVRRETIPAPIRYIDVDPETVGRWAARLGAATRPRIGLAWSGNPNNKNDRRRSIPLADLSALTAVAADIFVVQRDVRGDDIGALEENARLRCFGNEIDSFVDNAALVSLMDVVVSVDTSLAHLAAALGRPTWIMLPWVPDWRWMIDRDDSPWYPTVRLFRQSAPGDWSGVIGRIVDEMDRVRKPEKPTGAD